MSDVAAQKTENNNGVASANERTHGSEGADQTPVAANVNGEPTPAPAPTPQNRVEQAEVLADQLAMKVAVFTSVVGRGLFRFTARLREEVEDIWAEAQNLRRSEKQK